MIEAWFSSSLMTASRSSSSDSNTPPLASKQDENRIVASVPSSVEICCSSSVCWDCVPQMKRTLAMPKPHSSSAALAAATTSGWSASPR